MRIRHSFERAPSDAGPPSGTKWPWAASPEGISLTVRLTPRAQRDSLEAITHLADGRSALQARVRAVPEDGKANAALIRLLAMQFGLAASRIRLVEGATHRIKRLAVTGDGEALMAALAARFSL